MKKYILEGIIQPVIPWNGRIYDKEMMDKAIKDFLEKQKNEIRRKKLERLTNDSISTGRQI